MAEGGDDLTNCPVCFDEYTETGDHVPRILPCHHTLCEKCLGVLVSNSKIDCPECRVKHEATSGTRSFPQNKYIVTHLQKRQTREEKVHKNISDGSCEMCPEHDREKSLFCRDTGCQKPVCPICLARYHRKHQYVDLVVQMKKCEPLLSEIQTLNRDLQEKRRCLVSIKEETEKQKVTCRKTVLLRKDEVMKKINYKFESMLKEVDSMTRNDIDEKITSVDESAALLASMKVKVDPMGLAEDDITSMLETVRDMAVQTSTSEAGNPSNIQYRGDEITDELIGKLCGQLQPPDQRSRETAPRTFKQEKQLSASDFKLTVSQSIRTAWKEMIDLTVTADDSLVLSGEKQGELKLLKYDLHDLHRAPSSAFVGYEMGGTAEVAMYGKQFLAVSNSEEKEIEFRDIAKLYEVDFRRSVSPHEPMDMCGTSSGQLLFADNVKAIRWTNPKSSGIYVSSLTDTRPYKMQHLSFEEKELLVVTYGVPQVRQGGVHVYNVKTNQLEWNVEGRLPGVKKAIKAAGVTADEHGHVFVCDVNNECIQMFHVADGRYMGAAIKKGEQGLGMPCRITWCNRISSLVVVHNKLAKWHITVFKVERKN